MKFLAALGVSLVAGCGLVSTDVADVPLDLPDRQFSVDTTSWQIAGDQAVSYLATSCASVPAACDAAAKRACGGTGCTGVCDDGTQTCDLTLDVSLYQAIDVAKEQPRIANVGATAQVQVTIDRVTYEVTKNSLDVDTPALTLYVAPASVTTPGVQATMIGTIAPVAHGHAPGAQDIAFVAGGREALAAALSAYDTPFNVLVGSTLVLHAGDPTPTGKLDTRLHIDAHAGL